MEPDATGAPQGNSSDRLSRRVSLYCSLTNRTAMEETVGDILAAIRSGGVRKEVEHIRQVQTAEGKEAADTLKKKLPAATFSGRFGGSRKATEIVEHIGLLTLDFDELERPLEEVRAQLQADAHVLAVFVSPRGLGLKVLVPIPADPAIHGACFDAVRRHFREKYGVTADGSGRDVSRLCFLSYDPDLFIRPDARVFALPDPGPKTKGRPGIPKCVRLLLESGASKGQRNDKALYIATQLRDAGHDQESAEELVLRFADRCSPPLPHPEAIATVKSAFSRPPRERPRRPSSRRRPDWPPPPDPPMTDEELAKKLHRDYGPPFYQVEKKDALVYAGLNEPYWAAHHAAHHVELFEPCERQFYRYEEATGLFRPLSADIIKREVADALLRTGRACEEGLIRDRTDRRLTAIASLLRGLVERRDAFARNGHRFIHLSNGMLHVDPEDGFDLRPFAPDYYSRNQSPIPFDPEAQCARFLNELLLPAVTADDALLIQKYVGLCLLGHNLVQRFLILDGEAGRGKTQLALIMQLIVGQCNATQLRTAFLGERFEIFRFLGKTLLVGVDVPADFMSTPGAVVIKGLVGGDMFDAEQKGGTGCFPVPGHFNVLITSNSRLRLRLEGDAGAWRRRMMIVRFEAPPPKKKIPDFARVLVREEGPGILNWAMEGLRLLLQEVDEMGDIRLTPAQAGVVDSMLSESDSLRIFLLKSIVRRQGADLTCDEIVSAYAEYCPTKGWSPLPITIVQRELKGLMLEHFQVVSSNNLQRHGRNNRGFRGVGWLEDRADEQHTRETPDLGL